MPQQWISHLLCFISGLIAFVGYSVGDQLLKKVSDRLGKHLLATDYLARRGGDEFAIILNTLEHSEDPIQVASTIMSDLQELFVLDDYQLHFTASIV